MRDLLPTEDLALVPVSTNNWRACANLTLAPMQQDFVYSAAYSLAECAYRPELRPFAIEASGRVVGHLVLRSAEAQGWIHRLIIGHADQGRGYGRFAVEIGISILRREDRCREVCLAVVPGNATAFALYGSFGFRDSGELLDGVDHVLALALEDRADHSSLTSRR